MRPTRDRTSSGVLQYWISCPRARSTERDSVTSATSRYPWPRTVSICTPLSAKTLRRIETLCWRLLGSTATLGQRRSISSLCFCRWFAPSTRSSKVSNTLSRRGHPGRRCAKAPALPGRAERRRTSTRFPPSSARVCHVDTSSHVAQNLRVSSQFPPPRRQRPETCDIRLAGTDSVLCIDSGILQITGMKTKTSGEQP